MVLKVEGEIEQGVVMFTKRLGLQGLLRNWKVETGKRFAYLVGKGYF